MQMDSVRQGRAAGSVSEAMSGPGRSSQARCAPGGLLSVLSNAEASSRHSSVLRVSLIGAAALGQVSQDNKSATVFPVVPPCGTRLTAAGYIAAEAGKCPFSNRPMHRVYVDCAFVVAVCISLVLVSIDPTRTGPHSLRQCIGSSWRWQTTHSTVEGSLSLRPSPWARNALTNYVTAVQCRRRPKLYTFSNHNCRGKRSSRTALEVTSAKLLPRNHPNFKFSY